MVTTAICGLMLLTNCYSWMCTKSKDVSAINYTDTNVMEDSDMQGNLCSG